MTSLPSTRPSGGGTSKLGAFSIDSLIAATPPPPPRSPTPSYHSTSTTTTSPILAGLSSADKSTDDSRSRDLASSGGFAAGFPFLPGVSTYDSGRSSLAAASLYAAAAQSQLLLHGFHHHHQQQHHGSGAGAPHLPAAGSPGGGGLPYSSLLGLTTLGLPGLYNLTAGLHHHAQPAATPAARDTAAAAQSHKDMLRHSIRDFRNNLGPYRALHAGFKNHRTLLEQHAAMARPAPAPGSRLFGGHVPGSPGSSPPLPLGGSPGSDGGMEDDHGHTSSHDADLLGEWGELNAV